MVIKIQPSVVNIVPFVLNLLGIWLSGAIEYISFTIKKIIEWENRDAKFEWRDEISSLYSQVL